MLDLPCEFIRKVIIVVSYIFIVGDLIRNIRQYSRHGLSLSESCDGWVDNVATI